MWKQNKDCSNIFHCIISFALSPHKEYRAIFIFFPSRFSFQYFALFYFALFFVYPTVHHIMSVFSFSHPSHTHIYIYMSHMFSFHLFPFYFGLLCSHFSSSRFSHCLSRLNMMSSYQPETVTDSNSEKTRSRTAASTWKKGVKVEK